MGYQVTSALVIVPDTTGHFHHFYEGTVLPDGLDKDRVKQLAEEGMLSKVKGGEAPAEGDKPSTVKDILTEVGDDKAKAEAALEEEKAGQNRSTLVEKLEAIANG